MKKIILNNGETTLVDDNDFDYLNKWVWHVNIKGYVERSTWARGKGRTTTIRMQRVIMNPPANLQVDHINGNKLDNRQSNLRLATNSQNQANTNKRRDNTSGYKGITFYPRNNKWGARLQVNGIRKWLGLFDDIQEAKNIYNKAIRQYFGEYAKENI